MQLSGAILGTLKNNHHHKVTKIDATNTVTSKSVNEDENTNQFTRSLGAGLIKLNGAKVYV